MERLGRRCIFAMCFGMVALSALACREQTQPAVEQKEARPLGEKKQTPTTASHETVTEAEARAVLGLWLGAQNAGDFAAYEKLYATKFMGKKLAENRATHFGRAGWLEDRKAMFEKPFTVKASDVRVALTPEGGLIRFEQAWSNDNYRDSGTKLLSLVREGSQVLIAHEEMLSSDTDRSSRARVSHIDDIALVRKTVTGHAFLIPGPVDINWATDHPRYISDNEAVRPVSVQALPPKHRELLSGTYEVFDREGRRCDVKPKDIVIVLHVVPHFGLVNVWTDFPDRKKTVPHSDRALGLWRLSLAHGEITGATTPGMSLALEFDKHGDCGTPLWGRRAKEGRESPWPASPATPEEVAQIEAAARVHPEALARTKGYMNNSSVRQPGVTAWLIDIKKPRMYTGPSGQVYAVAQVSGHPQECGFGENTVFVWRKLKDRLVPVLGSFDDGADILAMVDVNGDGKPELIDEASVYGLGGSGYEEVIEPLELYLDCPC